MSLIGIAFWAIVFACLVPFGGYNWAKDVITDQPDVAGTIRLRQNEVSLDGSDPCIKRSSEKASPVTEFPEFREGSVVEFVKENGDIIDRAELSEPRSVAADDGGIAPDCLFQFKAEDLDPSEIYEIRVEGVVVQRLIEDRLEDEDTDITMIVG